MTRSCTLALGWILNLMIVTAAAGQESSLPADTELPPRDVSRIAVNLEAGVWIPRLEGDMEFGPNPIDGAIELKQQFNLNDLEATFNAELTLRIDDHWHVRASGFDFSTSQSDDFVGTETFGSLTLFNGDAFKASVDMWSVSFEAGIDLYRPLPNARRDPSGATSVRIMAVAGARYLDIDQDVELLAGGRDSASGDWLALYGGLEITLRHAPDHGLFFGRAFTFYVGGTVGTDVDELGLITDAGTGLTLEFTETIGLMFGYRLLEVDFEDGDYSFDAGLQGLFIAGSLTF